MNEIRLSDGQGAPSRRQLYTQHRALSRALMDSELQCLRRKGQQTITRLQSLSKSISSSDAPPMERQFGKNKGQTSTKNPCEHVTHRLNAAMAIFVEVDRAARRLEQLTEQRRERLREITRQQALEDEMNEVIFFVYFRSENLSLRQKPLMHCTVCNQRQTERGAKANELQVKLWIYQRTKCDERRSTDCHRSRHIQTKWPAVALFSPESPRCNNLIRFTLTIPTVMCITRFYAKLRMSKRCWMPSGAAHFQLTSKLQQKSISIFECVHFSAFIIWSSSIRWSTKSHRTERWYAKKTQYFAMR